MSIAVAPAHCPVSTTTIELDEVMSLLDRHGIDWTEETFGRHQEPRVVVNDDVLGWTFTIEADTPRGYRVRRWTPDEWDRRDGQSETEWWERPALAAVELVMMGAE